MRWSDISFTPSSRILRQFAGIWLVFFGCLAAWHGLVRHNPTLGMVLLAAAVIVGTVGLITPPAIRWIYVGATILTFPIGWVVSHIVLAVLFFGLFLPVALVFRASGRDALRLRRKTDSPTYWAPKAAAADVRRYFSQY
jgi:hypothetical protein